MELSCLNPAPNTFINLDDDHPRSYTISKREFVDAVCPNTNNTTTQQSDDDDGSNVSTPPPRIISTTSVLVDDGNNPNPPTHAPSTQTATATASAPTSVSVPIPGAEGTVCGTSILLTGGSDDDDEQEIFFVVKTQMPLEGDMNIEATNFIGPQFTISSIKAYYSNDLLTPIASTTEIPNALTIRSIPPDSDIVFKITGQGEGIFEISTDCRASGPTESTTSAPTTSSPTMRTIHSQRITSTPTIVPSTSSPSRPATTLNVIHSQPLTPQPTVYAPTFSPYTTTNSPGSGSGSTADDDGDDNNNNNQAPLPTINPLVNSIPSPNTLPTINPIMNVPVIPDPTSATPTKSPQSQSTAPRLPTSPTSAIANNPIVGNDLEGGGIPGDANCGNLGEWCSSSYPREQRCCGGDLYGNTRCKYTTNTTQGHKEGTCCVRDNHKGCQHDFDCCGDGDICQNEFCLPAQPGEGYFIQISDGGDYAEWIPPKDESGIFEDMGYPLQITVLIIAGLCAIGQVICCYSKCKKQRKLIATHGGIHNNPMTMDETDQENGGSHDPNRDEDDEKLEFFEEDREYDDVVPIVMDVKKIRKKFSLVSAPPSIPSVNAASIVMEDQSSSEYYHNYPPIPGNVEQL